MNTDRDEPKVQLTCGADADDLLAQIADGDGHPRGAHQQGCPHCQAALAEYDRLWSPVRELAAEPLRAPESVLTQALRHIRTVASNPTYGLLTDEGGTTRIAARAVLGTARETAEQVPGVRTALSRPSAARCEESDAGAAGVAGATTALELTLAAEQGYDLPLLGERIREAVADEIRRLTGLEPFTVTVVIDDVFTAPDTDAPTHFTL